MLNNIKLSRVRITDREWLKRIKVVSDVMIDYQWDAFHDNVEGAEKSYCIENFIKAASAIKNRTPDSKIYPTDKWGYDEKNSDPESFKGGVYQDSDLYKWLEAAAYSVINGTSPEGAEDKIREVADLIKNAAEPDGYIDTFYSINNINDRFHNIMNFHELYCFGHFIEAACACEEAIPDMGIIEVAKKYADFICETFGDGENQIHAYPGHEVAELALVKLYRLTGDEKYLKTAEYFVDERGKKPFYYDKERKKETDGSDYVYNQAHKPVRQQHEAVGHAVRGVYLYTGMAETARLSGDEELKKACDDIWNDIVNRKMYITGGIGSSVDGEAFSEAYYLPDDLAYAESCASVGLVFFADAMMKSGVKSVFGDVIEKCFYNNILGGMAPDGKSFFYSNPLYINPKFCGKVPVLFHMNAVRQKWFGCACCPPNIARAMENIGSYCYYEDENTVIVNLLMASEAVTDKGKITVKSDFTIDGKVTVIAEPERPFTLKIRIPEWSDMDGDFLEYKITEKCEINIDFGMEARLVRCNLKVRSFSGKVAVMRGPYVYCLEEIDNGENINELVLSEKTDLVYDDGKIYADGFRTVQKDSLYTYEKPTEEKVKLTFIPFNSRLSRGETEMTVFVRCEK